MAVSSGCLIIGTALLLGRRRVRMFWSRVWGRDHGATYNALAYVVGPVLLLVLGVLGLIAFVVGE